MNRVFLTLATTLLAPTLLLPASARAAGTIEISLGGLYHQRAFKGTSASSAPSSAETGGSILPAFGAEARSVWGSSLALDVGLFAAPEQVKPVPPSVTQAQKSVLFAQGWIAPELDLGSFGAGIGLYATPTYDFSFSGTDLVVTRSIRTGPMLQVLSSPKRPHSILWRMQLGLINTGSMGYDASASARKSLARSQSAQYAQPGAFLELEALYRSFTVEKSHGGVLKLGYSF